MLEYIVDLEAYSLLFSPRLSPQESQTEIIQFVRTPYSYDVATEYRKQVLKHLALSPLEAVDAAPQLFVYLFTSTNFRILRGRDISGGEPWVVQETISKQIFNLSGDLSSQSRR